MERSPGSRSAISAAALRLNANTRISSGETPWLRMRWTTFPTMTEVFPVPAPASTRVTSSSVATDSACSFVRGFGSAVRAAACTVGALLDTKWLFAFASCHLETLNWFEGLKPAERLPRFLFEVFSDETLGFPK